LIHNRTHKIIEYLVELAKQKYDTELVKKAPHPQMMLEVEKQVLLRSIDNLWVEHLVAIDYLRTGIGLRGYGQRDPLVEYKKETYRMFNELLALIQKEVVYFIYKMSIGIELAPGMMKKGNLILQGADDSGKQSFGPSGEAAGAKVIYNSVKPKDAEGHTVGRNDPCYCGSGIKFKKCHGKNA
jgi:preprotein translocase subunit SecA